MISRAFPNCFTFSIIRIDGKFKSTFEVSYRKNEVERIFKCLDYLRDNNQYMVAFNSFSVRELPAIH